jgi:hypothetical protein
MGVSDGTYDGFVGPALSAIIDAQIKTGVLRFDAGQYQRPAAFGAGRPKVVDKLKIKRVYHATPANAFAVEIASQFALRNSIRPPSGRNRPVPNRWDHSPFSSTLALLRRGRRQPYNLLDVFLPFTSNPIIRLWVNVAWQ